MAGPSTVPQWLKSSHGPGLLMGVACIPAVPFPFQLFAGGQGNQLFRVETQWILRLVCSHYVEYFPKFCKLCGFPLWIQKKWLFTRVLVIVELASVQCVCFPWPHTTARMMIPVATSVIPQSPECSPHTFCLVNLATCISLDSHLHLFNSQRPIGSIVHTENSLVAGRTWEK